MPMTQGFWATSPRIHRSPSPAKKHLSRRRTHERAHAQSASRSRRKRGIIMDAILPQCASGSYYGQWPLAFPKE